jgi:hypothetical protein
MRIDYDDEKRQKTLEHRGLDFVDAPALFSGPTLNLLDDRFDYGEARYQTVGWLDGRMVMVVWTARGDARRIISMRRCNDREEDRYRPHLDRSG